MNRGVGDLDKSLDEMRLAALMRHSQKGDASSYRTLLFEIEKIVSRFVKNSFMRLGLGASDAWEDIVQEILLSIHSKRATYNPDQYFLPWLYSIARYKVIDFARATRTASKYIDLEIDIVELEVANHEEAASHPSSDLQELFNELPLKQRQVLELVKIHGLTIDEAAHKTGFSQSDIKVTVHRAIKSIKAVMARRVVNEKA